MVRIGSKDMTAVHAATDNVMKIQEDLLTQLPPFPQDALVKFDKGLALSWKSYEVIFNSLGLSLGIMIDPLLLAFHQLVAIMSQPLQSPRRQTLKEDPAGSANSRTHYAHYQQHSGAHQGTGHSGYGWRLLSHALPIWLQRMR
jgi:hypothetical protein